MTAIVVLDASTLQVGFLQASGTAAAAAVGLFAGVVVDRASRRSILIMSDIGRAILSLTIPSAWMLGVLRIEQLYAVALFTGAINIFSDVAGMAFLPAMLKKEHLVEGNSKLGTTESAALIAGPGISGLLVQALSAPIAIVIDSATFLISAIFVWRIRSPEKIVVEERRGIWTEIGAGLSFVYRDKVLRPLAESIALYFLFRQITLTLFTLYAVRELGLSAWLLGIVFSALGFGFLAGSLTTERIKRHLGTGRTMLLANLINIVALALVPVAGGSTTAIVTLLAASHLLHAFAVQVNGIHLMSLRQAITPHNLQGRMNASFRFVNVGMMMIGALIAGFLGEFIGLRITLAIGAVGMLLPFLRLLFSPIRDLD